MEPKKPNVTVSELKRNYVNLPESLFTRRMTANEFGAAVLLHLKTEGLGIGPVKMLGYSFTAGLSPVEIAVYGYLCFNPVETAKRIAKARKLTDRIVSRSMKALEEMGLISGSEENFELLTLADLFGDPSDLPESESSEISAAQPDETAAPKLQNE